MLTTLVVVFALLAWLIAIGHDGATVVEVVVCRVITIPLGVAAARARPARIRATATRRGSR